MKIERARRRVTARAPSRGRSASTFVGVELGPSMSVSMIGFHESGRYCVISLATVGTSSGTVPGRIIGEASWLTHNACTTELINRSTPRVIWKRSSVDQSSYSRSNSSGCSGYAALIRVSYAMSLTSRGNSPA